MVERPFFLVGAERSGTTLLRLMLDHHPRIACHYEFEHVVEFVSDAGEFPDLDGYREYAANPKLHHFENAVIDPSLDYPRLVDSFLEQKRRAGGKELVGGTVHEHFDRLLSIWPDAVFVHICRDPRDVARSCIQMGWVGNTWVAADRWLHAEETWERLSAELPPERYLEIKYENFIADTDASLRAICDFLELEFSSAMYDYARTSTYDLPDPELVYQWRQKASERDVQLLEARVGDLLVRRGYEPSGLPPIPVSQQDDRRLRRESLWYTRRFNIRRYGFASLVGEKTLGRLPPLRRRFASRRQRVAARYIK